MHPSLELGDALIRDAVAPALVRVGRVGEAIAKHPIAARKRRTDDALQVLVPGREHQEGLALVQHGLVQKKRAKLLAKRRSARFARCDHFFSATLKVSRKPSGVRALARPVDAFQRDEAAVWSSH